MVEDKAAPHRRSIIPKVCRVGMDYFVMRTLIFWFVAKFLKINDTKTARKGTPGSRFVHASTTAQEKRLAEDLRQP